MYYNLFLKVSIWYVLGIVYIKIEKTNYSKTVNNLYKKSSDWKHVMLR